jgi:hypothetical protein
MAKYTVIAGQSLNDVAALTCGTVEAVLSIISLNNGININSSLTGGQILNVPEAYPKTPQAQRVFGYLSSIIVKPATQQQLFYRITEEGEKRLTEDNHNRIVNGQ